MTEWSADITLRQLRYFALLGRQLNYRRAAEMLYITQPALSVAIKQLEGAIGVRLFVRDTKGVRLTPAGESWLPKVEDHLAAAGRLVDEVRVWAEGRSAVLRIGYLVGIGSDLLTQILPEFEASHPEIRVDALEYDFSDPTVGLASGSVEVAFLRPPVDLPDHSLLRFAPEHWVACLPRNHRLAERESLQLEELLDEPIVAAPPSAGSWRDYWIAAERRRGKPANIVAVASTYESELTAVARGIGVSFTSSEVGRNYQRPGIVFVPIVDAEPIYVALAWNPRTLSPAGRLFVEAVRGQIALR